LFKSRSGGGGRCGFFCLYKYDRKGQKVSLTEKQKEFAKLKYKDELTDEEIALKIGIGDRTVYRWTAKDEVQKEIDRLGEADTKTAIRYFQKNAKRAAKATVKLTETEDIKDKKGKIIKQIFIYPGEVVRKASADILQALKIDVKGGESGSRVLVYLPDNKRQKDDSN